MAFSAAEWKAITWYAELRGWKIKDMAAGPIVRFRDPEDGIEDVNIQHIKEKYKGRPRSKRKVES